MGLIWTDRYIRNRIDEAKHVTEGYVILPADRVFDLMQDMRDDLLARIKLLEHTVEAQSAALESFGIEVEVTERVKK